MATDPFDVTNSDGDNGTANFFRNLQAFGGATMQAANTYGPNGFLTYGAGPAGAIGVGLNAAAQQSRENATSQANIGKTRAETTQQQQANSLFPYQLAMAKFRMQQLQQNPDFGGIAPQGQQDQPTNPNTGQNGQGGSSAGASNSPATTSKVSSTQPNFDLQATVQAASQKYNIPAPIIQGIIQKESYGTGQNNPDPNDGQGYMGINAVTAKQLGVNVNDPVQNIDGGTRYLRQQLDKYGDMPTALAAYNAGPNRVDGVNKDLSKLPPSVTNDYIPSVMNYAQKQAQAEQTASPPTTPNVTTSLPQTTALLGQLQGQRDTITRKMNAYEMAGLPTTSLKANLDAVNKQIGDTQGKVVDAETKPVEGNLTKSAENLADTQKAFNAASGNLPRAMERFEELRRAAPLASSGGFGTSEDKDDPGFKIKYAQSFNPKTATANNTINQISSQGILPEIGPIIQATGSRGNQFVEKMGATASGIKLSDPPETKISGIQNVEDQYVGGLKSLAQQRRDNGDSSAPTDKDIDTQVQQAKTIAQSRMNAKEAIANGGPKTAIIRRLAASGIDMSGL